MTMRVSISASLLLDLAARPDDGRVAVAEEPVVSITAAALAITVCMHGIGLGAGHAAFVTFLMIEDI